MMMKLLKGQTKTTSLEAREVTDIQGSGENPNPIKEQKVEILEEEERRPPLEPIPREETVRRYGPPGRRYGKRHERVGHERRDAEFEKRLEDYDRGMLNLKGDGLIMIKRVLNLKGDGLIIIEGNALASPLVG
ncbi:hypothetical protein M5K25_011207 [Dendrobium thyrsiflorum]|uniref:Uncharacterized protein n=1 Tax=Dendrobium thyrsiflorum TaxID=117978 RepID=A0ABD0V9A0_DENTH